MFAAMDFSRYTMPQTLKSLEEMGEEQDILVNSWGEFLLHFFMPGI